MQILDWVERWEEEVPLALQEERDHSGRQFGRFAQPLTGIVFALDFTKGVLERALQEKANLIVTHHPVLFSGVHGLDERIPLQDWIIEALENNIAVYASHTAWDWADGGVNDTLGERAGLSDTRALVSRDPSDPLWTVSKGKGVYGTHSRMRLDDYAAALQKAFDAESIVYYGNPATEIHRVACLGGAGMDFVPNALKADCDVMLTGDVKYHEAQDALRAGLCIIDLGHYAGEFPAMGSALRRSRAMAPGIAHFLQADAEAVRHNGNA